MNKYNGWKNYETWNVALWIGNDEGLYELAKHCRSYKKFVLSMHELSCPDGEPKIAFGTPDGVAWNDPGLDIEALDRMILEL